MQMIKTANWMKMKANLQLRRIKLMTVPLLMAARKLRVALECSKFHVISKVDYSGCTMAS